MPELSAAVLPQIHNSLKRSASTASLPTPPRTHRRHARGRSRGSCDSDSDHNLPLPSETDERSAPNKRRRTKFILDDEDAFWLNPPQAPVPKATGSSESVPLLYRKSAGTNTQPDVALVSPPPSHRKQGPKTPAVVQTPIISPVTLDEVARIASPPTTPKRPTTRRHPRDSPENPFLATPAADSDSPGVTESSADPSPHTPIYDKPYVTYVLCVPYSVALSVSYLKFICFLAVVAVELTRTPTITMQRAGLSLHPRLPNFPLTILIIPRRKHAHPNVFSGVKKRKRVIRGT